MYIRRRSVKHLQHFDLGKGRGGRRSQMDSCGMLVERKENTIVYKCNDAGFQSDFDKLIFEIELL